MPKNLPDVNLLSQILAYDKESGILTWKHRVPSMFCGSTRDPEWSCKWWNSRFAGKPAGNLHPHGYVLVRMSGVDYKAHRLIWLMSYGVAPEFIDHINGVRDDNRLENLRSVSWEENTKNAKRRADNVSGVTGVSFYSPKGTWRARINYKGRTVLLGYFKTPAEAVAARRAAEKIYGYHENHGR